MMITIRKIENKIMLLVISCFFLLGTFLVAFADQPGYKGEEFGYYGGTMEVAWRGTQALQLCNSIFLGNRTVDQIYEIELALPHGNPKMRQIPMPIERIEINENLKGVAVGVGDPNDPVPVMRAVIREGFGGVILPVGWTFDDIGKLPQLKRKPLPDDPAKVPWPNGDLLEKKPMPPEVDMKALEAAGDWIFNRVEHGGTKGQVTSGLLVVYKGDIIYERYLEGFNLHTPTRTWSTSKSINSTLIGIAIGEGLMSLNMPLPVKWPPYSEENNVPDPRKAIRLRDVIHMSSGLNPIDDQFMETRGSHLAYWAGWNSAYESVNRGLVAEPGTVFNYENYDTLLSVSVLRNVINDDKTYWEYPYTKLFDKIGMRDTYPGVDPYGNFVLSSQLYTTARDLARVGLLYLNKGEWNGEQVVPSEWVKWARSPSKNNNEYGGQFWLMPDEGRKGLPMDAFSTSGAQGNFCIIIPSYDLIVVRRGIEQRAGNRGVDRWDILREVLKAFPKLDYIPEKLPTVDDFTPLSHFK